MRGGSDWVKGRRTHESVDFRVFLEHKIERQGREENDRLHVVEVRDPVRSLRSPSQSAMNCALRQLRRTMLRFPPTS